MANVRRHARTAHRSFAFVEGGQTTGGESFSARRDGSRSIVLFETRRTTNRRVAHGESLEDGRSREALRRLGVHGYPDYEKIDRRRRRISTATHDVNNRMERARQEECDWQVNYFFSV